MAIVNVTDLLKELPTDASDSTGLITNAVNYASRVVHSCTCDRYEQWDECSDSLSSPTAPDEIIDYCKRIAIESYFITSGEKSRTGMDRNERWDLINKYKAELRKIDIAPVYYSETITLDTNRCMQLGTRNATTGRFPQVIPHNAQIISATTNKWIYLDDFVISKGGELSSEYYDAWYLRAYSSAVEGTIKYMRTFRIDGYDYIKYRTGIEPLDRRKDIRGGYYGLYKTI